MRLLCLKSNKLKQTNINQEIQSFPICLKGLKLKKKIQLIIQVKTQLLVSNLKLRIHMHIKNNLKEQNNQLSKMRIPYQQVISFHSENTNNNEEDYIAYIMVIKPKLINNNMIYQQANYGIERLRKEENTKLDIFIQIKRSYYYLFRYYSSYKIISD